MPDSISVRRWCELLRPGDWAVVLAGLAACVAAGFWLWRGSAPDGVVVRASGKVVAEAGLSHQQRIEVKGPLGVTVIEIEPGRARVASDPGPRQYCVRQGWLARAGAVAICAPNEVSLTLTGRGVDYDSLNY
ncbi:MAG: NusG domain II-containing protein [Betaproteobacteria bacterium]|nr:NusG domain II-containing protein [Betaproteobacteria bacterium]